ncbi:MAG: 2-oxoglutarate dehydrogenase complex dihydrolipoyllysine-residue succinyltransferase [Gemmatimonadetes bacterium]|jgi:2-oxoglutarate dehydrogenase E2 component (dihydrolipoamide succinyltransferase)|nr:2-oxoglutarate dehydrogenase complex dihydrolipoyllysine-residue succinyltransferase [Gemmatimonadota bacterium]MBT6144345.1 2-oxoglutarate dehydrogenase complex dihydrolipoyllysine-residue succinyltransferase [Gemmatimonadota bacterium]MBT7860490.1 2-oxoglutarate dehydrogenase complex dihydrolipoyllysine-residue succinyltransferase [Gemmatimonadota bacterium]
MVIDVDVPEMGESVSEVTVLEWLKSEGEFVEKDEPICVLETDKANVDLPAPASGTLQQLRQIDDTLSVGQLLARIDEEGTPTASADPEPTASPEAQTPVEPTSTPQTPEPAPESLPQDSTPAAIPSASDVAPVEAPSSTEAADLDGLSPAVRRLVEENDLDPGQIMGTGRSGRLIKQDITAYLKERERDERDREAAIAPTPPQPTAPLPAQTTPAQAAPAPVTPAPSAPVPRPAVASESGGVRREPMSRLRKRVASRLVEAQRTAAMLTTFNEVDLSQVMSVRKRHKEAFQAKYGVSLGLMSFFSRAVVIALQEIPAVNASVEEDDIVYHDYVNLGIAVSTERGLLVPILRNIDQMSMAQIESEIKRLALAARDNKLALDELSGGTFSITNGGIFGSMMSTPILTPPQSGILGMHAIKDRPIAVDGDVVIRPMMYTALTYDHRLVDGQQSVRFLVRLKELLEDPARLMLEI